MALAHLEKLNPQQRRAVEHGIGERDTRPAAPLLVIAGAGSGKTNTLAHRVAHLIVNGADPRRILLMTFSRRASVEMARRVERITRNVLGGSGATPDALAWAGTFHGIGARLLRHYAEHIGLDPAFTIHDREDSADLMNLVRHALGFSKTETRFPTKGTCISIYSRCDGADAGARNRRWCGHHRWLVVGDEFAEEAKAVVAADYTGFSSTCFFLPSDSLRAPSAAMSALVSTAFSSVTG